MKITVRAVQASFDITDASGNSVASYSVENATFVTDINGLLNCVSQAAMLFKQLDAQHSVPSTEPVAVPERITVLERSREAQVLLDTASAFQNAIGRRQLDDVQHDCCMEVYTALKLVRSDASSENMRELCKAASEFIDSLGDISTFSAREVRHADKLRAAIAAV